MAPRNFILLEAVMKGVVALIPFSVYLSLVIYRQATDFYELVLYSGTLLSVYQLKEFPVEFLGHLYNILSPANKGILTSSLTISFPLISFSCLTAFAKTSSAILNRCGESGQPCIVANFRGIPFSFSLS